MIRLQERRNVVKKKFYENKILSFVDLWLYFYSLRFILNFYKLPWKKTIYASFRSSTVKLVNQYFLIYIYIYMCICIYIQYIYIYIYQIYIYIIYIYTQSWIQFLKLNLCSLLAVFSILFFFKSFLSRRTMYILSTAHNKVFSSIPLKCCDEHTSKPNLQNQYYYY